jgi:hypothetical protein
VKTVEASLVIVLVVSLFVSLVCATLALTVGESPVTLGSVSAGTALTAAGLLGLGEAVSKSGSPARWRGSGVKVGRLSSFAFGAGCCAMGVVFLGYDLLPERGLVWAGVVILASFALGFLGMWTDRRAHDRGARQSGQAAAPGTGAG